MNKRKAQRAIQPHDTQEAIIELCIGSLQPQGLTLHDGNSRTSAAACSPTSCLVTKVDFLDAARICVCVACDGLSSLSECCK
jgi:hypothetical protein